MIAAQEIDNGQRKLIVFLFGRGARTPRDFIKRDPKEGTDARRGERIEKRRSGPAKERRVDYKATRHGET